MKKQLFIFWVSVYLIAPTQAGVPNSGPLARIGEDGAFSFVVIGDTRTGIPVFKQQRDEINRFDPDFVSRGDFHHYCFVTAGRKS